MMMNMRTTMVKITIESESICIIKWSLSVIFFNNLTEYIIEIYFLLIYNCTFKRFSFNCVLIHTLVTWSFFPLYSSSICWWWWICTMVWTCASDNIYIYIYTFNCAWGLRQWQLIWDRKWNKELCLISQEMKCSIIDTCIDWKRNFLI